MTTVVTRLFDTYDHARQAVQDLEASGIPHGDISLVASNADNRYDTGTLTGGTTGTYAEGTVQGAYAEGGGQGSAVTGAYGEPVTAPGTAFGMTSTEAMDATANETTTTGAGATIGTILGGGAGLLAGLGLLAIPGVGPIVAAGWLIATITGAGIGAAGGGILGSLVGAGVPEEHAHVYAEGVRRGGTLVTVRVEDARRGAVEQIMNRYTPVDLDARAAEYRAGGWSRFDEEAPAYAAGGSPTMGTPATTGAPATGLGTTGTGIAGTMAGTTPSGETIAGPGAGTTSRL
jgi:hypothetical protein